MLITSLMTLSGVAVMFGVGSVIKNGGEILSELNVGMKNKNVRLGKDKKDANSTNDEKFSRLHERVRPSES